MRMSGVPSFDNAIFCCQPVPDKGWVSVNAFAHVQLRSGVRARVPVGCPLASTGSRGRPGRAQSAAETAIPVAPQMA